MSFIPFHVPSIGEEEIDEVVATLRSGWITSGKRTTQFEQEFRDYVGAPYSLAVNSCTAGLHLALAALNIGPGDEVITTPITFCATVNTILHVGATPVLADVDQDGNMDPESIRSRITPKTRAILPVHLGGLPCDMLSIWQIAKAHNLFVIEDAAHAVGSHYRTFPIGAGDPNTGLYSDAVAFSFYATKTLTTGEGGMVTTHSQELIERMRVLCLHGISKDAWNRYAENGSWYYQVVDVGFKYNLSDIQSAIGIHQLRKQERFLQTRSEYARYYTEALRDIPEFLETPGTSGDRRHAWHLYMLRLNLDRLAIDRATFIAELHRAGVGASVHFIPIPLHPAFAAIARQERNYCPKALAFYPRILSLPLYPGLTTEELRHVVNAVKEITVRNRAAVQIAMT